LVNTTKSVLWDINDLKGFVKLAMPMEPHATWVI